MKTCQFVCLALLLMAGGATTLRSCASRLRLIRPHLFTHCECEYSNWSTWKQVPNSVASDATGRCSSGESYEERRTKFAIGHGCQEQVETRRICKSQSTHNNIIVVYTLSDHTSSICNITTE